MALPIPNPNPPVGTVTGRLGNTGRPISVFYQSTADEAIPLRGDHISGDICNGSNAIVLIKFCWLRKTNTRNVGYLAIADRSRCVHKVTTILKWKSKVTQGRRKCHDLIEHIWFPITVPQQLWPIMYCSQILVENREIHIPHLYSTSPIKLVQTSVSECAQCINRSGLQISMTCTPTYTPIVNFYRHITITSWILIIIII